MPTRWQKWRSQLNDNATALFGSCLILTGLVVLAILFFSEFGGGAAAVIYQDF